MSLIQKTFQEMEGVVSTRVALEAAGIKDHVEEEITIYAKIGNMEGLAEASLVEQHEQAEIKTDIGKIRIRKTTINGRLPVFDLTTKRPTGTGSVIKNRERSRKINEETYNLFMDVCPTFMAKTRYVFKAERLVIKRGDLDATIKTNDLAFEVDVFTKSDGSISEWCKIDIETDKIAEILTKNNVTVNSIKLIASISGLPFMPNFIVIDSKDKDDEDKKQLISALYKNEFLITREK